MNDQRRNLGGVTLPLIIAVDLLNALAELSFKRGAMAAHIGHVTMSNLSAFTFGLFSNTGLWVGILCYLLMFLLWMIVLSRMDLSVAFLMLSTDYLLVPLFSILFLKESVSVLRWMGILWIVVGIGLTSWSTISQNRTSS